jgi:hypothetical protein
VVSERLVAFVTTSLPESEAVNVTSTELDMRITVAGELSVDGFELETLQPVQGMTAVTDKVPSHD